MYLFYMAYTKYKKLLKINFILLRLSKVFNTKYSAGFLRSLILYFSILSELLKTNVYKS